MEAKARGEVDVPIIPLLDALNSHPLIVTTSSCSGRVVLLSTDMWERKRESAFHRKWHRPVSADEVWEGMSTFHGDVLWLKVDPFIIHVGFGDVRLAMDFLRVVRGAGVKIAGIQWVDEEKAHVEVRGIDHMAVPVVREGHVLVNRAYVRELTRFANVKMVRNAQRLARLFEATVQWLRDALPR